MNVRTQSFRLKRGCYVWWAGRATKRFQNQLRTRCGILMDFCALLYTGSLSILVCFVVVLCSDSSHRCGELRSKSDFLCLPGSAFLKMHHHSPAVVLAAEMFGWIFLARSSQHSPHFASDFGAKQTCRQRLCDVWKEKYWSDDTYHWVVCSRRCCAAHKDKQLVDHQEVWQWIVQSCLVHGIKWKESGFDTLPFSRFQNEPTDKNTFKSPGQIAFSSQEPLKTKCWLLSSCKFHVDLSEAKRLLLRQKFFAWNMQFVIHKDANFRACYKNFLWNIFQTIVQRSSVKELQWRGLRAAPHLKV